MSYNSTDLNRIGRYISNLIEDDLAKTGIFYRIFFRGKSSKSLSKKLELLNIDGTNKYDGSQKFIRDLLGIRINLFFVDDLELLVNYFKSKFKDAFIEEAIDKNTDTEFKPTRVNLIFKIPSAYIREFQEIIKDNRVDCTFELQLRTIISEGWHEVEHDFRYKCQVDWVNHVNLSRTFNGILAALETHEWSMIKIFEELSYSHYKTKNYSAMIRVHLRIRTEDFYLSETLNNLIVSNESFTKDFFKLERIRLIEFFLKKPLIMPFTLDNLTYFINYFFIKNSEISEVTPILLLDHFKEI